MAGNGVFEGLKEGGMVAFRAAYLKPWLGIEDPHAHLFVGGGARRYAAASEAADRRVVGRSLARYRRFGERMAAAATRLDQMLFLGVGYDTRALWLPEIVARGVRVLEVDLPSVLDRKLAILAENGVRYPDRVVPVGIDLASPGLLPALEAAGFDPSRPTGVFAEGVTFHLPAEATRRILDPRGLGLAAGSEITFDYWTRERVERRNARYRLEPRHGSALPENPAELASALAGLGYRDATVLPLSSLAAELWPEHGYDQTDWFVVEATLA